jgi:hypothetical protein
MLWLAVMIYGSIGVVQNGIKAERYDSTAGEHPAVQNGLAVHVGSTGGLWLSHQTEVMHGICSIFHAWLAVQVGIVVLYS